MILSAKKLFWLFQNYRFHHTFLNSSCKVEKKKKKMSLYFLQLEILPYKVYNGELKFSAGYVGESARLARDQG